MHVGACGPPWRLHTMHSVHVAASGWVCPPVLSVCFVSHKRRLCKTGFLEGTGACGSLWMHVGACGCMWEPVGLHGDCTLKKVLHGSRVCRGPGGEQGAR